MAQEMSFEPDYRNARVRPSPNFGERRDCIKPDTIILHYTGMATAQGAEDWLCDTRSQVSSHYLVYEDGAVVQMVPEKARAWHAGKSYWHGETDMNSRSVGIEIANPGHDLGYSDFPDVQIDAVIDLCRDIIARWSIRVERVLAHSDIAPSRKIDPGEKFPWRRLAEAGVCFYVEPGTCAGGKVLSFGDEGGAVAQFQSGLTRVGYGISVTGTYDAETVTVVKAFQRRFRPDRVDGVADAATQDTLLRVLKALRV